MLSHLCPIMWTFSNEEFDNLGYDLGYEGLRVELRLWLK